MDNKPLARAVIVAMDLFENAHESDIELSYAVKCGEIIAHELHRLTDADRDGFVELLEEIAAAEADPAVADHIRHFPVTIWGPREYWHLDE